MKHILFNSIKAKLIFLFLAVALVPIFILGFLAYRNSSAEFKKEAFAKLAAVSEIKTTQIEVYFEERSDDLTVLANMSLIPPVLRALKSAYTTSGQSLADFVRSSRYSEIIKEIDSFLMNCKEYYGYYDLFLTDRDGNLFYTVEHQPDFGTNLISGKYSDTNLSRLVRDICDEKEGYGFTDFEPYAPSDDIPASFIAHGVYDEEGDLRGVMALQISIEQINAIMQESSGLGDSGETYLVGSDYLMRSDSRFEADTILKRRVETEGTRDIFTRRPTERGLGMTKEWIYKGYNGKSVLGHNNYLKDRNWAVMAEVEKSEALGAAARLRNAILLTAFLIAAPVGFLAIYLSNKISNPIKQLSGIAGDIARGDLTRSISIKSKDEIGLLANSFSTMAEGLSGILVGLQDAINQLSTASSEILATSEQQAANAKEQSAAISETTSAAVELSKSAEQVGENIKIITQASNHSLVGMAKIKDAIGKTGQVVTSLSEKSQEIGKITELIDGVADQTNLLAVNAAIEAARAGDQGKGFTVVADEIRKLADSTGKSTKDITSLIELIQHEMTNILISMEESTKSVEDEVKIAQGAAEKSKEISMSANQQVSGSKQIADSMNYIDEAMKEMTQGIQKSQTAAEQLSSLGEELRNEIKKFKINKEKHAV